MAQYKIDYKVSARNIIDYKISATPMQDDVIKSNIGHSVSGGKRVNCKIDVDASAKYYTYTTTDTLTAIPGFVDRYGIHTLFVKITSPKDDDVTTPNLFVAMNWPIITPGDELVVGTPEFYTDDLNIKDGSDEIIAPTDYYNTENFYNNENFYLEGVDDCMLLRTRGIGGRDIFFRSTAVTGLCNIEILVGGDR